MSGFWPATCGPFTGHSEGEQIMNLCSCTKDGWCPRYGRDMTGRFREICAGINCDLGTSAAFRLQWENESHRALPMNKPIPLLLKTSQAPGDAVAMTAAIYSLHKAHPGKYITAVESLYPEVFQHNPAVRSCPPPDGLGTSFRHDWHEVQMHYPAIHDSNRRGIHFMEAWCEFLSFALNDSVPLLTNRPHLYFDYPQPEIQDYWIVCSGGKNDFTNKLWGHRNYQEVVSRLEGKIKLIQVGTSPTVEHPKLGYAKDMVGKTTLRQLFDLVRKARGVLCGVSLLMHVAAALEKPAIVIAGGREPVSWNAYPKQQYLHTVGMLPCHSLQRDIDGETPVTEACWRSRTIPLGDNKVLDEYPCLFPQEGGPKCMSLIEPRYVADLILKYDNQYGVQR